MSYVCSVSQNYLIRYSFVSLVGWLIVSLVGWLVLRKGGGEGREEKRGGERRGGGSRVEGKGGRMATESYRDFR